MSGDVKLKVADRWPTIYNWAHGGTVSAPVLIAGCRDVIAYLGGSEPTLDADDEAEGAGK